MLIVYRLHILKLEWMQGVLRISIPESELYTYCYKVTYINVWIDAHSSTVANLNIRIDTNNSRVMHSHIRINTRSSRVFNFNIAMTFLSTKGSNPKDALGVIVLIYGCEHLLLIVMEVSTVLFFIVLKAIEFILACYCLV